MGNFWSDFGTNLGMDSGHAQNRRNAEYRQQLEQARSDISSGYDTAGEQLTTGMNTAMDTARSGFNQARQDTSTGYGTAQNQLTTGMNTAVDTAREGYKTAQGRYETEPMVTSRAELTQRALGKGGYDEGTLNAMKAGTREEYGTSARDLEKSLKTYYGDSSAQGLAGENLARGMTTLGEKRAGDVRDIDISNAQLIEQQQTDAITALNTEAYQRAGLDADEAQLVSGLQRDLATGTAQLTAQQTNMLADLAAREGTTLAELQGRLATGQAALTSEEAQALAEIEAAGATGTYTVGSQRNLLQGIWGGSGS